MRRQRLIQSERVAVRQRAEHSGQLPFPTLQHLLVLQPHERRRQHPPPPLQRPAAHGRRRPQHIHRLVVLPRAHKDRSVRRLLLPAQPPVDRVEFAPRARLVRWHLPLLRVPRLRQMVDIVALLLLAQVPPARAERQAKVDGGRCPAAVEKRRVGLPEVLHAADDRHVVGLERHLRRELLGVGDQLLRRRIRPW